MLFHWSHSESPRTCEDPAFGPIPKVFSEVAALQTLEIERVAKELKESMWGRGVASPNHWPTESVPWLWGDCAPPELWVAITAMLRGQSVIDLTPGPVIMLACQDTGVAYNAIAHNTALKNWLAAVAEKAALKQLGLHYFFS